MTWPVTAVRKFRMSEAEARTHAESEIQSQAETGKVHNGEWKPLCGYEVFDMVYWPNEERKASPNMRKLAVMILRGIYGELTQT